MESAYVADFQSFHHEFRIVAEEVLQTLARKTSPWEGFDSTEYITMKETFASSDLMSDSRPVDFSNRTFNISKESRLVKQLNSSKVESPSSPGQSRGSSIPNTKIESGRSASASVAPKSKPRPRKGHTKSRRGCLNCKQRKIKCPETQPACVNCIKVKLECNYPAPKTLDGLQGSMAYAPNPVSRVNLQSTPVAFSSLDMRLFHHFLLEAYPHLPLGNDDAWTYQVPLVAHHNQYLMHAILGMAASHMQLITGMQLNYIALQHRMLAIKGSNEAISRSIQTGSDGDALLASCYCLAFQSSYMVDGMQDCFRLLRGCKMIDLQLRMRNLPMAFFLPQVCHFDIMQLRLVDLPIIEPEILDGAKVSLQLLHPRLEDPSHCSLYPLLLEVIETLRFSSLKAYFEYLIFFQNIVRLDADEFESLIDPTKFNACILLMHFLAIEIIMEPINKREWGTRCHIMPTHFHLDWIPTTYAECPSDMRYLLEWPMKIATSMGSNYFKLRGRQTIKL